MKESENKKLDRKIRRQRKRIERDRRQERRGKKMTSMNQILNEVLAGDGLPRQRGIARKIIERILCDARWSKVSQAAIARHVGVSKG